MEVTGLLDVFPLWVVLLFTIVLGLISVELGHRVGRYRRRYSRQEKESLVGGVEAAALGLLAFMLAFTFGLAGARFEDRRQTLLAEANAIGTAYLRAAMLPEPMRTQERDLLRQYVDVRLEAVEPGKLNQAIAKSEELQNRLWEVAVAAAEKDRTPITALYVQSLNEVIDLHAKRLLAGVRSRVPAVIWIVLYLLVLIAMLMMGYHSGLLNSRRSIAVVALIVGFSSVLFLIADLDRPVQGTLQVSQQAMIDLRRSMTAP